MRICIYVSDSIKDTKAVDKKVKDALGLTGIIGLQQQREYECDIRYKQNNILEILMTKPGETTRFYKLNTIINMQILLDYSLLNNN